MIAAEGREQRSESRGSREQSVQSVPVISSSGALSPCSFISLGKSRTKAERPYDEDNDDDDDGDDDDDDDGEKALKYGRDGCIHSRPVAFVPVMTN
jgi:hypothetical protein